MSRGRGSQRGNNRSEKNRLLRLSFLSPFASFSPYIEEQELDERLTAFEVMARFQQKRYCIEALKRGEDLDEPTDSERRFAFF